MELPWRLRRLAGFVCVLVAVLAILAGAGAVPAAAGALPAGTTAAGAVPEGAADSGWFSAPLPRQAVVDGSHLGTTGDPLSCVVGSTDCVAVVSSRARHGSQVVLTSSGLFAWSAHRLPVGVSMVSALACATRADCLAAGSSTAGSPELARSSDGGRSWRVVRSPSLSGSWVPTGLACPSTSICWLAGRMRSASGAVLALSRDGGRRWKLESARLGRADVGALDAISCPSLRRCVAVGGSGSGGAVALVTTDGGVRWSASSSAGLARLAPLNSVSCAPRASLCAAAGALVSGTPVVALSRDGGSSWVGDTIAADDGPLSGVSCATRTDCWAAGSGQLTLLGTADAGRIWQPDFFGTTGAITGPGAISCPLRRVCVATTSSGLLETISNGNITPSNGPSAARTGQVPPGSVGPVVASATSAGVSVDPTEAQHVARSLWSARALARHDRDPTALALVESGPALAVDAGECYSVCEAPPDPPLTALSVAVPRQSGWPASFVAIASYTEGCDAPASPCNDLFVATQPQAGAPFTIAFVASDSATPPEILTDGNGDGYELAPPPGSDTEAVLGDFATLLESIKTSDSVPSGTSIAPDAFIASYETQNYLPASKAAALGFTYQSSYTPDAGATYQFDTSEGTLSCGTVDYEETNTPLSGLSLAQTIDRSVWPSVVPPGTYSRVVTHGAYMVCFVPSTQLGGHVVVLDRHGVTGYTGTLG